MVVKMRLSAWNLEINNQKNQQQNGIVHEPFVSHVFVILKCPSFNIHLLIIPTLPYRFPFPLPGIGGCPFLLNIIR